MTHDGLFFLLLLTRLVLVLDLPVLAHVGALHCVCLEAAGKGELLQDGWHLQRRVRVVGLRHARVGVEWWARHGEGAGWQRDGGQGDEETDRDKTTG